MDKVIKDYNNKWAFDFSMLDEKERPFLYCTNCNNSIHPTEGIPYNFCPFCGDIKHNKTHNQTEV